MAASKSNGGRIKPAEARMLARFTIAMAKRGDGPRQAVSTTPCTADQNTIEVLRELLQRAEVGQLNGLVFAISNDGTFGDIGITGDFVQRPANVLAVASRLNYAMNRRLDERKASPGRD